MWCKIDLTRLVVQLLPPILRGKLLVALLKVLIGPLAYIYDRLLEHRDKVLGRLNVSANVIYLAKMLNEAFFLNESQIYITTFEEDETNYWHLKNETAQQQYMSNTPGMVIKYKEECSYNDSFYVYVPTFLCTSLVTTEDKYQGKNLVKIKEILKIYKPAGRTYSIILYDYE